jgi:hypothetical protein
MTHPSSFQPWSVRGCFNQSSTENTNSSNFPKHTSCNSCWCRCSILFMSCAANVGFQDTEAATHTPLQVIDRLAMAWPALRQVTRNGGANNLVPHNLGQFATHPIFNKLSSTVKKNKIKTVYGIQIISRTIGALGQGQDAYVLKDILSA